jgi:hypothetical protein
MLLLLLTCSAVLLDRQDAPENQSRRRGRDLRARQGLFRSDLHLLANEVASCVCTPERHCMTWIELERSGYWVIDLLIGYALCYHFAVPFLMPNSSVLCRTLSFTFPELSLPFISSGPQRRPSLLSLVPLSSLLFPSPYPSITSRTPSDVASCSSCHRISLSNHPSPDLPVILEDASRTCFRKGPRDVWR